MLVPEAAMHEHNLAMTRKHNIWPPGQILYVKAESVTHAMQRRTHHHLRLGVSASNVSHIQASAGWS
jgi:hypothetical protein